MDFLTFNYQIITFLLSISKRNTNTAATGYVICLFCEGSIIIALLCMFVNKSMYFLYNIILLVPLNGENVSFYMSMYFLYNIILLVPL